MNTSSQALIQPGQPIYPLSAGLAQAAQYPPMLTPAQQNTLSYRDAEHFGDFKAYRTRKDRDDASKYQEKLQASAIKEDFARRREFQSYGIAVDSRGFLCKQLIDEDEKIVRTKAVCDAKEILATEYVSYRDEEQYAFVCVFSESQILFCLREEDWNPESMSQAFAKAGYPIQASREYRKNLNNLVFGFLQKCMKRHEIPLAHGWREMKSTGEWFFSPSDDGTMEELKKWKK